MKVRTTGRGRDLALATLLLAATAFAWLDVIRSAGSMQMMPGMEPLSGAAMVAFTLQWGVMMTAMMLPSAAPMILLYARSSRRGESSGRVIAAEVFALTYVALWLLTGVPVYIAWVGFGELAARSTTFAAAMPYAIGASLFIAGVYQLSPAKHACLRQCQAPADFLMRRWRSGYAGSMRLAAIHAAYCIGCCWALMLILIVAGAMSLPWVLAIALVVFAEKVLPAGERTARIGGVILIVAALTVAVRPELASVLRPQAMH
jgi:predicted metal-binding membrane protein